MVSIGTEGPSCLLVSPLVVLWGEAALGREALLSAFLVGAGSPVRELMVKVTVPPTTSTPHSAFTYTSTGKPGSGGSTVQHPAGATFGRAAGLVEAVTTWSPGTPLSSLSRGTWYRAVGRLPRVPARTGNWAMRIFNQALGNRPGLWRLVRDSSCGHLGAWAPRQSRRRRTPSWP